MLIGDSEDESIRVIILADNIHLTFSSTISFDTGDFRLLSG